MFAAKPVPKLANDMMKDQLNDLVEYLKSIGDAKNYMDEARIYEASVSTKKRKKK